MVFSADQLRQVSAAIHGEPRPISVELIRNHTQIADSTAIYLVDGDYILHVSPAAFPEAASREARSIEAMRGTLGGSARVLPEVAGEGRLDGLSFMAVPRLRPLGTGRVWGRIERMRIRGAVLEWLRELAALAEPVTGDTTERFRDCLAALAATPGLASMIAREADAARKQLQAGALQPRHVPMHGDLWSGNLMRRASGALCVIDWGGAQTHGYGIYDLIRLGESLRIPRRVLRRELAAHTASLGGADIGGIHLLAALGHYAENLGEFPRERFVAMAGEVWRSFSALR